MEVSHHTPSEQEHSHPWPSANSDTVLILMRRPAQNSAAVTPTDFGRLPPLALTWVHRVPVPYVLSDSDVSAYTVLTCLWQENTVNAETINTVFCLCLLTNRPGTTFLLCKGISRLPDCLGIHAEDNGNLPFRASFERVFPSFSAQTFRLPCGRRDLV